MTDQRATDDPAEEGSTPAGGDATDDVRDAGRHDTGGHDTGGWTRARGPLVVAVAGLLAAVSVATALLRPDPLAASDEVRDAAAGIAEAVTDGGELTAHATEALARQVADGRVDAAALEGLAGYAPDDAVVLHVDDREARALVVLRNDDRRRLELILVRDGTWRLDRFELY